MTSIYYNIGTPVTWNTPC